MVNEGTQGRVVVNCPEEFIDLIGITEIDIVVEAAASVWQEGLGKWGDNDTVRGVVQMVKDEGEDFGREKREGQSINLEDHDKRCDRAKYKQYIPAGFDLHGCQLKSQPRALGE